MTEWLDSLPGERVTEWLDSLPKEGEPLGGSSRSHVRRVRDGDRTVIVKEFLGEDEGWVREAAALSVLPETVPAPRLLAASEVPPVVAMTDLGTGPNVADALLGTDRADATEAVLEWATAIGRLHVETAGSRDDFRAALGRGVAESALPAALDDAVRFFERQCAELDVVIPPGAFDELRGLTGMLGDDRRAALTPGDACPDNNVRTAGGLMLLDFESAEWRHRAWDVVYLVAPWPSCWCAWRMPAEVSERALDAYGKAFGPGYPGFRDDIELAKVGWAFISTSWFLPRALTGDASLAAQNKPSPSRRAAVLHRLFSVRENPHLPALSELAARLHETLAATWGELPLPYAPAFQP